MYARSTRALGFIALLTLAVTASLSLALPSIATAGTMGARTQAPRPPLRVGTMPERNSIASFRPRHVFTSTLRTDRRGNTAPSATYYKITNITAEVGGISGIASAVNEDGRIGYTDSDNAENVTTTAFIVNNGGTFDQLFAPYDPGPTCRFSEEYVAALNENAEAVGSWGCSGPGTFIGLQGFVGWSLPKDSGSSILYFDQDDGGSAAFAVNDHDVAVGEGGYPGSAIIIEPSSGSTGRIIPLRGLRGPAGSNCLTYATSINNAGKIVGTACNQAAVFSTSGYAKPLGLGRDSAAEAVNQHGDIVGTAGPSAFLVRDGRILRLPKPASYNRYLATAFAVNAADEVVGTLNGPSAAAVAFVYANGHAYTLDSLLPPNSGWHIADALGVNDHGEIVGDGYYNGNLYGVSLKPPHEFDSTR